jgi:asparagine synthase (glutamine-hydrolysing)
MSITSSTPCAGSRAARPCAARRLVGMCGITGYTGPRVAGQLEQMTQALIHRGPDDEGFYEDDRMHLGMRRLAIIDLEHGDQPKRSANGRYVLMFNGEIYNYRELKAELEAAGARFTTNSDTEVVLRLFETEGIAGIERLVGMFAFAIYDATVGTLHLVRDRLGKKPIYYTEAEGRLVFASEFAAIPLDDRVRHIDTRSLVWYFGEKTTPGDASIDTRVRKLPAGHWLRRDADGTIRVERYWEIQPGRVAVPSDEGTIVDELDRRIAESVRLRMVADVEVGAYLSGGIDSSLCVAHAAAVHGARLKTYCLVYDDPVNEKAADREFAKLVSERYGTEHHEVLLTPDGLRDELPKIVASFGQPNSAVLANWFISKEMGKAVKVALSGDGADELFGSYFLHRAAAALQDGRDDGSPEATFARAHKGAPLASLVDGFAVFPSSELDLLLAPIPHAGATFCEMLAAREAALRCTDPLDRMLEFDCRNLLVDQILNYADVLAMAHSLEIRTPFLDHRLVDLVFSVPSRSKIKDGQTKWLLKQVALRYLPRELVERKKEGFVEPSVYWIQRELKDWCRAQFASPRFNALGYLDTAYARGLVDRFYSAPTFDVAKKVWTLLMYALWEQTIVGP